MGGCARMDEKGILRNDWQELVTDYHEKLCRNKGLGFLF